MEVQVAELKLELKQWELHFLKAKGRKPTKSDAAECPEIKKKYDKFLALKKDLQDTSSAKKSTEERDKENLTASVSKQSGSNERKILSPKNEIAKLAPPSTQSNVVWGNNLLKKNAVVVNGVATTPGAENFHSADSAEKEKKEDLSEENSPANWRDKMRKNIGLGSAKKLPTSLKRRSKLAESTACESMQNRTLGLDDTLKSVNGSDTFVEDTTFGCQVNILKKSASNTSHEEKMGMAKSSSPLVRNSPFMPKFGAGVKRKSSLLSRPIKMDAFEAEDLSDLQNFVDRSQSNGDADSKNCVYAATNRELDESENQGVNDINDENVEPFKDETESFIEANFRDKPKKTQFTFSSDKENKISYEDVCLDDDQKITLSESKVENENETEDETTPSSGISKGESVADRGHKSQPKTQKAPQTNFVRLNMKKKCFSRKGGGGNFLRKQVFRQKLAKKGYNFKSGWKGRSGGFRGGKGSWKGGGDVGYRDRSGDKCYKCGGTGHWANKCKGQGYEKKKKDPEQEAQEKESLDEILENIDLITAALKGETSENLQQKISLSISEAILDKNDDAPLTEKNDIMNALKMFKYTSFRPGQDKAISQILKGLPTLLVLSTGSGKSLCYQLPAYLYAKEKNAITLVISPLVSLMDDQVRGLPKMMKATRVHSGMTKEQRDKAMEEVESGKVHVLLVSPEAITSWAGMSPKYSPLSKLPPVAFACIDECHCLSEWSHAFRPSYLRVCQVLRDQLGVKCLVGLTATATMDTCGSVARQLGIEDLSEGVIAKINIPENLVLSVSKDRYKDEALSELLVGDRFSKLDSVIVYCTRRDEASRIASLLRVKMQDMPALEREDEEDEDSDVGESSSQNPKKRKRGGKSKKVAKRKAVTLDAECYHAGMSAAERRRIQNKFMNGTLRVVVATVAFGMGIDKQDVRSVIHYNMPMSFERFVQEVGRAGRDGKPAHCHLFLDSDGGDLCELSRHSYGKTMDRYTIKKFVKKVFPICDCDPDCDSCSGHFSAIEIDSAIEELDVKREGLETLLCYLEIERLIQVHLPTETKCSMQFYGGPGQMIKTAKKCNAVALALKLSKTKGNECNVNFNAMKIADELNMDLSSLKRLLRYLTYDTSLASVASEVGKSGIEVEFSQLSFCVQTKQKATDEFLDAVTDLLHRRVIAQENKEIAQLKMCFNTMQKFSHPNVGTCRDSMDMNKSSGLKNIITEYFKKVQDVQDAEPQLPTLDPGLEADLRVSIRQFLHVHSNDLEHKVTGRAIARIFHGIDSPRYPARNWGPVHRFWRSKLHIDFNVIRQIATEEIVGTLH